MQEKDIKFNENVVKIMLTENDQYKLRDKSTWDEDNRDWTVPLFILHKMQDEVAFPTIGAKARVEQAREERTIQFGGDSKNYRDSSRARSRSKYMTENTSEQDGGDQNGQELHDSDMQWNKFGKAHLVKNQNKSGNMSNGDSSGLGSMRRTLMNDKIDGVHDRRNKYLGAQLPNDDNDRNGGTMER